MSDFSPERCLRQSLDAGLNNDSLSELIHRLGGLVYHSALRRTGNRQLSEEITQNVFVIFARKADSLRTHPSLSAWLHRTTRFETEKALEREIRHQRRLQQLTSQPMDVSAEPDVARQDQLRLLEQALDQLKESDRQLILARFFEGLSFREIATRSERSEAACKMQLRRTLDHLSGWLHKRGCTLGLVTITTLLSSELSRACPAALSSTCTQLFQFPPAASPQSITQALSTMKASKMISVSSAILILGLGIPASLHFSSGKQPSLPKNTIESRSALVFERPPNQSDDPYDSFPYYDCAYDRLEEIYAKHPNLRPKTFIQPEEHTLIEEIRIRFERNNELIDQAKLPRKIAAQLSGRKPWDSATVTAFLEEREDLLNTLLSFSKYSTRHPQFFYRFHDSKPEISNLFQGSKFLNLALADATRRGDSQQVAELAQALQRFSSCLVGGNLVHGVVSINIIKGTRKNLRHLASEGFETPLSAQINIGEILIDNYRTELMTMISLMEFVHTTPNREDLVPSFSSLIQMSHDIPKADYPIYLDALRTANLREVQDRYAAIFSQGISVFSQATDSIGQQTLEAFAKHLRYPSSYLQGAEGLILDLFQNAFPNGDRFLPIIHEHHRMGLEIETLIALNRADRDHHPVTALDDLVPTYLTQIPRDPVTLLPFSYDEKTEQLLVPGEK